MGVPVAVGLLPRGEIWIVARQEEVRKTQMQGAGCSIEVREAGMVCIRASTLHITA